MPFVIGSSNEKSAPGCQRDIIPVRAVPAQISPQHLFIFLRIHDDVGGDGFDNKFAHRINFFLFSGSPYALLVYRTIYYYFSYSFCARWHTVSAAAHTR